MRRCLALVIVLILLGNVIALATVTDISFSAPVIVGSLKTYTIVSNQQANRFGFDYRCTESGINGSWLPDPRAEHNGNQFSFSEKRVGNFDIRGWAREQIPMTMPPQFQWDNRVEQITVLGPTDDEIDSGLNVNSVGFPVMGVEMAYTVWAGSDRVFDTVGIDGVVQYKLGNESWAPANWANSKIVFNLFYTAGDVFANSQINDVLAEFTIQNRFRIDNCHQQEEIFYFTERTLQAIKTSAASVKFVEKP